MLESPDVMRPASQSGPRGVTVRRVAQVATMLLVFGATLFLASGQ